MAAGQTLRDHLIELAEAPAGTTTVSASGTIDLPDNAYELDKLKRKFNEGLRLIGSSNPSGWYCLRRTVVVQMDPDGESQHNIDGDNTLHRLPDDISGDVLDEWEWEDPAGSMSGSATASTWSHVDSLLACDDACGRPQCIAVQSQKREASEPGVSRNWWRARVFPRPDLAYLLKGNFYAAPDGLSQLDDKHPFGAIHDPLVLAAARWCWVKNDSADLRYAQYKEDFERLLAMSIAIDRKNAPATLAATGPQDPHDYNYSVRTTTINGVSIL